MAQTTISGLEQAAVIDGNMLVAADGADQTYSVSMQQIKDFSSSSVGTSVISDTSQYTDIEQLQTGNYQIIGVSGILCGGQALPAALANDFYAQVLAASNNMLINAYSYDNVHLSRVMENGVWLNWQQSTLPVNPLKPSEYAIIELKLRLGLGFLYAGGLGYRSYGTPFSVQANASGIVTVDKSLTGFGVGRAARINYISSDGYAISSAIPVAGGWTGADFPPNSYVTVWFSDLVQSNLKTLYPSWPYSALNPWQG